MSIAWDYLSDIAKTQLLHFRPDLFKDRCKRCGGILIQDDGEVECLFCAREHDQNGKLILARDPIKEGIVNLHEGGRK